MAKAPLRVRLAKALLGTHAKDFIPPLSMFDGWTSNGRISTYGTKGEQLGANLGWCYSANTAIVDPCAAVALQLYKVQKNGEREEVTQHEILELLNNPNAAHTGEQLRQLHETYMNFNGEGYIYMTAGAGSEFEPGRGKLPDALQVLPSHQVDFRLNSAQYSKSIVKYRDMDIPLMSVIRDLNPDPMNIYSGRSVIAAAASAIDTDQQMRAWNQGLFNNGARPSVVFKTNEQLSDEAYTRWKEQFRDQQTGSGNAYKPLLIEGGDVSPYMLNSQDLDFLNSRKFSMSEIYIMWRVSPAIVGALENANRSILDSAFYNHAITNIVPRMRRFVRQLNVSLVKPFDPTLELDYENPIPEDEKANLDYAKAANGGLPWLTPDEVRAMYGEKDLPDDLGKMLYFPARTATLAEIADTEEPADNIAGDEATADPPPTGADDGGKGPSKDDAASKSLDGVKKKT